MTDSKLEPLESARSAPAATAGSALAVNKGDSRSHLQTLPSEILRRIFQFALPQGVQFFFAPRRDHDMSLPAKQLRWNLLAAVELGRWLPVADPMGFARFKTLNLYSRITEAGFKSLRDEMHFSLLHVNRYFAAEARGE